MSKITETGLVAFFDILGYSAFIENNAPEIAAKSINKYLTTIDEFASNKFVDLFKGGKK